MKFERGRNKNQLIWSFILKVIASQSLVNSVFKIKPQKGKRFEGNTLTQQENAFGVLRLHLTRERADVRVTDSGSRGPTSQV